MTEPTANENQQELNATPTDQELEGATSEYDHGTIGEGADLGDGTPLPGCGCDDDDPANPNDAPRAAANLAKTQAHLDAKAAEPQAVKGDRSGPPEKRMQGHWLLAQMGKRVLRPGGIELTEKMLAAAKPASTDEIVEFGPGVGRTTQELLNVNPVSYCAVDPNVEYMEQVQTIIATYNSDASTNQNAKFVEASAHQTGLPDECASLVIGEAMLTMHNEADKLAIIKEAYRLLKPGGRYAIHELAFKPDDCPEDVVQQVLKALSRTIRIGARPLPIRDWERLFVESGFTVEIKVSNPMHLLEPRRIIADEGLSGAFRFFNNVRKNAEARKRIGAMRRVFKANEDHLCAVAMVLTKQ